MRSIVMIFVSLFHLIFAGPVSISPLARIIGGQAAKAGQFPWQAAITVNGADTHNFCGGVLLNTYFATTAGHCIVGAKLLLIHLGSNKLNATGSGDPNVKQIATSHLILHPEYSASTLENDIALAKFNRPLTYNDYVINIPIKSDILPDGSSVIVSGWGQTSDNEPGPVLDLQYVRLVTISNKECSAFYGAAIKDGMMCAVGNLNEGFCTGDSGGALIVEEGVLKQHFLVGLASFKSQSGCESIDPSGFTRISYYADWINGKIA